jgi:NAD(P)-dependent dehydrogenase (short-subunit alcohol dehydrogenase family)
MSKKILIVGASGTVGQAVVRALGSGNHLIEAGRSHHTNKVDITDSKSIQALFQQVGKVDAIVSVTGQLHFGPLNEMTAEQFQIGLKNKLLGQIDIALVGQHYLNEGGSITLTSGIVSEEPIRYGVNATTVNAALEGFVRSAACEMMHGQRINVVSPSVLQESLDTFGPYFRGFEAVPGSRVALAYLRSIEGVQTGKLFRVW